MRPPERLSAVWRNAAARKTPDYLRWPRARAAQRVTSSGEPPTRRGTSRLRDPDSQPKGAGRSAAARLMMLDGCWEWPDVAISRAMQCFDDIKDDQHPRSG